MGHPVVQDAGPPGPDYLEMEEMMMRFSRNPARIQVPVKFSYEPETCEHRQLWYVTPTGNLCGGCGMTLPKPEAMPSALSHPWVLDQLSRETWGLGR